MRDKYLIPWCALAVAAGIWLADLAGVSVMAAVAAGGFFAMLAGAALYRGWRTAAWGLCLLFACAAGMGRLGVSELVWEQQSLRLPGTSGTFLAVISGEGERRPGLDGWVIRYPAEMSSVRYDDGAERPVRGAVYIYTPWDRKAAPLPPDTAVAVTGELSPFRFYKNPGKMDLESRYRSERLIGRIYTEEASAVQALGRAGEYSLEAAAAAVRSHVRTFFGIYMDPARLSVLMTLLFGGQTGELPEGVMDDFTATGIVHILSVSGSHIALLFGFLCLLGRWLQLPERVVLPAAVLTILAYAALAGFVPPVLRAALMGVVSVTALFFRRRGEAVISLGTAVLLMLLWEPLYVFDVSFQLSVGASAGLVFFYPPLLRFLGRWPLLPRWVREGTALSVSAQLLTVPVVLYDFHRLPLYFLPANLFVTPLLEWVIILGLGAALVSAVFAPLAGGVVQLGDYFLWGALRLNSVIAALPHAVISAPAMAPAEAALYYGAVLLAGTRSWWTAARRRMAGAGLFLAALLSGCALSWAFRPEKELFVPDLGASRAAVLTDGEHTILYYRDSGLSFDIGEREIAPVLAYKGIGRIDVFIGDFRECREPSPLTLDLPIGEIWLPAGTEKGAALFAAAHPESHVRVAATPRYTLSNGMTACSNGESWYLEQDGLGWYFDGGGSPIEGLTPASPCLWIGGTLSFRSAVNRDTINWLTPAAAVYAGNRSAQAGEDRDYFLLCGIPFGDPFLDGMVTLAWDGTRWTMDKYRPSGLTEECL